MQRAMGSLTPLRGEQNTVGVNPWRVESDRVIVDRKWLRVRQQHVTFDDGGGIPEFHLIEAPDWAAIVALTATREAVLVRQYRHGLGGPSVELPAGVVDGGETPRDAALRELQEETGYSAPDAEPLSSVATETARHTNRAHFFFARDVTPSGKPTPGADERIEVLTLPARELVQWALDGRIAHGVHVGAILTAAQRGWL